MSDSSHDSGSSGLLEAVGTEAGKLSEEILPPPPPGSPAAKPIEVQRLKRNQLGTIAIATATMANVAPAMSFYFGFGFLALTAGIASPLTIIAAGIAVGFLCNTLAEFSKVIPSTGSFVTFIGKAFGPTAAIAGAFVITIGYIFAAVGAMAITGGFTAIFLNHYISAIPTSSWPFFMIAWVVFALFLWIRGIRLSTRWVGGFFAVELTVLFAVSIIALIHNAGHLTLQPFNPHYLSSGFKGLSLGFPLAVFMFMGWENAGSLAEETDDPRRNVPRALFASVGLMMFTFVLLSYATVEGFQQNITKLTGETIPFMTLAGSTLGALTFFAYVAGVSSSAASWISSINSEARILFSAGREGLAPNWFGRVYLKRGTPVHALAAFSGCVFVIVFAWAWTRHIGPVGLFAEPSTLGTIMVLVVWLVGNLALPVFFLKHYRDQFNWFKHLVLPVLGAFAIGFPLYELVKPGQPAPYNWFPYASIAVIILGVIYGVILTSRDKTLGDRVGSVIADE